VVTPPDHAPARPGTLYVVATPIGNLGDLSPRAAEVLRTVAAVAAGDTRRTMKLFAHLGVPSPALLSLPAFDERARVDAIVARLRGGDAIALCTDAGTPGVSDPGAALVAAAWAAGIPVVPVPGPSAALAALAALSFQRLAAVQPDDRGGVAVVSAGRPVPPSTLAAADRDVVYLAVKLALVERALAGGKLVAIADDAFGGLSEGARRVAARLLKGIAKPGQLVHATTDPSFRGAADHAA
jgi:hypothetical protein